MKDGGQAFPTPFTGSQNHPGMTLREYYIAHAPAQEIENMIPDTAKEANEWLGLPEGTYNVKIHYVQLLAKARCIWADAMLEARAAK